MRLAVTLSATLLAGAAILAAQSRPVPPPGITLEARDRAALEAGLADLKKRIEPIRGLALWPDVQVFHDAVRFALENNEFFAAGDVAKARDLLRAGNERADQLSRGSAPWTTATGLVVRGYVSKIDKSVQPYGLVIPESFDPKLPHRWRLDAWFHGRGETLSEVNFLADRMRNPGEFTPPNAIVVHLYGRYCNANKFAGEVDLFEAIDDIKKHYRIDDDRIVVRGFSMGGAAAWHFAAHHAGRWAAAAPGAGFSESADFLKIRTREKVQPNWWEEKLWRLYDATEYAANLTNLPVVAYSGEIDGQKQAADMMAAAMEKEGLHLTHIIGPQTPHRYHADSKIEINRRIDAIAARGRVAYPRAVRFTTYTLRYNRMKWLRVDALGEHWEKARLDAEVTGPREIKVTSANVTAFSIIAGPGSDLVTPGPAAVVIDGQRVAVPGPMSDGEWSPSFVKTAGKWAVGSPSGTLRKKHGLQGPVDDAFMNTFLIVRPTGQASPWVTAEMNRAIKEWRRQFRGEAQVKDDTAVTEADIASANLILWGDPSSNKLIAKMADKLPVTWSGGTLTANKQSYDAATHAAILAYPNPLNPSRYVVLNSGFTFREYDALNNARQIPKLPDWAIVDTRTPPDDRFPGKIAAAGFFGENWEWLARR